MTLRDAKRLPRKSAPGGLVFRIMVAPERTSEIGEVLFLEAGFTPDEVKRIAFKQAGLVKAANAMGLWAFLHVFDGDSGKCRETIMMGPEA